MKARPYLSIAGSLLLATVVWLAVTLNKTYTTRLRVPLVVVNLPPDIALAEPLPGTVEVALEGRGWQLVILAAARQLAFELPGARLRSDRMVIMSRYFDEALHLPEGVMARSVAPDTVQIVVDQYVKKKVPIRLAASVLTFRQDYGLAGPIILTPDSIEIIGADKTLRGITSWPTEPARFGELSNPVVEDIMLADSLAGVVRFRRDPVKVYIPVEQLADVVFEGIPVIVTDAPQDRHILLANPFVTVHVRGGVNRLAVLEATDFTAAIEYAALMQDTTGSMPPVLRMPDGVTLLRCTPPRIRYTVRQ